MLTAPEGTDRREPVERDLRLSGVDRDAVAQRRRDAEVSKPTTLLVRVLSWSALMAAAAATLLPIDLRPVSSYPVSLERVGAYAVLGLLFAVAYPKHRWAILIWMIVVAGLLEAAQTLTGTRHGRMPDFLVKAAGAVLGVCLAPIASWLRERGTLR